jgi:PIN domain nuclease of toxin-antitoxin system
LIDTHVFLWAFSAPQTLSPDARLAIANRANDVFVSSAVGWELAIKYQSGKLDLPLRPSVYVSTRMASRGFLPLTMTMEHVLAIESLPDIHRDPFDRIMIAQAQCESLTFVTRDAQALRYPLNTMRA